MSDFEDLRRGSFHADAQRKAAQQEASELGRRDAHYDALSKAAQQEAADQAEEREAARRARGRRDEGAAKPQPHDRQRDLANHTVIRRTDSRDQQVAQGGAVVSRRSGLGASLRRWVRERRAASQASRRPSFHRDWAREQRAWEREQRAARPRLSGLTALLVTIVAIVGLYLVFLLPIDRAISFTPEEREGLSQELSWHVPGLPYYVLALGSDAREGDTVSRTDTMILVRVDLLAGKLTMLSIPRDTMVQIEGQGTQKINAAYAFGGVAGAVDAVHDLTGAPISQAALIRFDGIENLVDYLGGVTVNVPVEVNDPYYTGLVLPAGEQEMDGHTAMLFSRVRHGFDLGDYQRQKDQRILIEAIMHKALSLPPTKLPGLVSAMGGLVGTTMRSYSILPLMLRLKLGGGATIYQATLPSEPAMVDGISYVIADEEALAQMMAVIDAGGDPATLV